jgi:hypothetical protein
VWVVLEVEHLEGGGDRVHFMGVYPEGTVIPPPTYHQRNVVQAFFGQAHDVAGVPDVAVTTQPCECGKVVTGGHHCWIHHCNESHLPAYRVCGECLHIWTMQALLAAHAELVNKYLLIPVTDPSYVFACPLCAHDF